MGPEFASAIFTRADGPQIIKTINARRVSIVEIDLQGVIADGMRRLRAQLWLEHRERRRTHERRGSLRSFLFHALIIYLLLFFFPSLALSHCAVTILPPIGEILDVVMAPRARECHHASAW